MKYEGLNKDGLRVFEQKEKIKEKYKSNSKGQHQYSNRERFTLKQVFDIMDSRSEGETYVVINGRKVEITNTRLETFRKSVKCVNCQADGSFFSLEKGGTKNLDHFNLYKKNKKEMVSLMTQDHILPKSKGGSDDLENLQTMCSHCNNRKGDKIDLYMLRVTGYMIAVGGINAFEKIIIGKPTESQIKEFFEHTTTREGSGIYYLNRNKVGVPIKIEDVEVIDLKKEHNKVWSFR